MHHVVDPQAVCWRFAAAVKAAVDPHGILAPGRYHPIR